MDLVDDFQPEFDHNLDEHCTDTRVAVVVPKQYDISLGRTQLILCPNLFDYGTIEGGKVWPHAKKRKCSNIGDRVSRYMLTLGSVMLHEYTHASELVQPPLEGPVIDHVYSFYKSRNLKDKELAKSNADNYASFAIELAWTLSYDRDFAPPVEDNSPRLSATGAKGQRLRRDVQLAPSLGKRTPLPRNYGVRTPNTEREHQGNKENTFSAQEIEQFQEGHNDALMMCSTVIEKATKNPKRFDRIFREYFPFNERQLIIGEYAETVISIMAATCEISSLTGCSQVCSKPFSTPTVKAKATPSSKISTLWTTTRSPRISRISGVRRAMPLP
jgi:hypothetical protein